MSAVDHSSPSRGCRQVTRAAQPTAREPARHEWWVGASTAIVMIGHALMPASATATSRETRFDVQQTGARIPAGRPDDLYEPLPGDRGAHGDFDARSHVHSLQWELTRHRVALAGAALVGASLLAAVARRRPRWTV